MARRYYSSTAVATTLSGNINNSTTSITVTALSGYPAQFPYTAIIDPDTASEEVVTVTAASGTTLTVTRGVDGTSAVSHNAGAVFRHGVSARDFDEANAFVNGGGVANALVGGANGVASLDATGQVPATQLGNASGARASGVIYENAQTISANYTMTTSRNGLSAGPITIGTGVTVTVPSGSVWAIV